MYSRRQENSMDTIDALGGVGEIVSWIGLGLGLPVLLIGIIAKAHTGRWCAIEVAIVSTDHHTLARWYAAEEFYERRLTSAEIMQWGDQDMVTAWVSERRPNLMRFEPKRHALHVIYVAGITLSGAGLVGMVLSFIPLFVA